jgi:hypothetical protein
MARVAYGIDGGGSKMGIRQVVDVSGRPEVTVPKFCFRHSAG